MFGRPKIQKVDLKNVGVEVRSERNEPRRSSLTLNVCNRFIKPELNVWRLFFQMFLVHQTLVPVTDTITSTNQTQAKLSVCKCHASDGEF